MTVQLPDLLALEDPIGFVTITASFAPATFDDRGPSAPPAVRSGLRELVRDADEDVAGVLEARLDELDGAVEDLLDPKGDGRGRLLVAGVSGGEVHDVRLQAPLPTEVRFEDGPALRRVLEVVDEHGPAGVLLLHREEALLLHLELGAHEPLESWSVELGDRVFADEFYGPSPANPAMSGRGVTHREHREDRVRANLDRFHDEVAADVRDLLATHGLDRVVLVGPAHERDVVAGELDGVSGLGVLHLDRVAEGASRELLAAVEEVLTDDHRRTEVALVRRAVDRASAGGAGVTGLAGVLHALDDGRVHHLLLAPRIDASGWIDAEGRLAIQQDDPRLGDGVRAEQRMVHRMIERALATDAAVTPVDDEAAELLNDNGGVAALLRW